MMYGNKLAVAIKSNGKVLREFKDLVYLPFGAEYSIYIKNMNTVRASIKVMIDGNDIGDGTTFVVPASGSMEIERFVKNGNFNKGNRFKFIERNAAVENHRGVGGEDGLVVIEYQFEKRAPKIETEYVIKDIVEIERRWPYYPPRRYPDVWYGSLNEVRDNGVRTFTTVSGGSLKSSGLVSHNAGGQGVAINMSQTLSANAAAPASANAFHVQESFDSADVALAANDVGITAAGSVSDQKFQTVAWFPMEMEKYSLVLKLLGQTEQGKQVVQAVTVKKKQKCSTCGHTNKANAKFCTECGTSLELV